MRSTTSNVLPESFSPSEQHIIIGRGRVVKEHPANVRFDRMIKAIALEYSAAACKADKGLILSRLMDEIHETAPDAGFVKRDQGSGRWYSVEESLARTTAAQALRNFLSSSYRSSKHFKSKRRMEQIQGEGTPVTITTYGDATRCVSPYASSDDEGAKSTTSRDAKTFAILASAFGQDIDANDDPFSPRPIAPMSLPKLKTAAMMLKTLSQPSLAAPVSPVTQPLVLLSLVEKIRLIQAAA